MSTDFTVYQATNPATAADVLEEMATRRPDLRQFVAANPAAAPETLEWLGTLGEPAVDAALARRGQGSFTPPGAYAPPASSGPYGPPAGSGPYGPPAGAGQFAAPGGEPYAPPASTGPYGPPAGAPYAAPAGQGGPYGPPPGYPSPGYPPAGGYPGPFAPAPAGYGYQQQPAKSRTGLVVAIAVGAVVVLAALVFAASSILGSFGGRAYGDDPHFDRLWDQCAAGDGVACDDLYRQSPLNSEYEEFGDTCGHRFPPNQVWCDGNI